MLMTDERRIIQETARAFAMEVVLPIANKLDPLRGRIFRWSFGRRWPKWVISAS